MTMTNTYEIANEQARMAVTWACGTIALKAPWLELRACREGWDVWWRETADQPACMHDTARGLDWFGLCAFAHGLIDAMLGDVA